MRVVQHQWELLPSLVLERRRPAGAWFWVKQAHLAKLPPQYNAGNLSTSPGDNVGLRLLGRYAAQFRGATSRATFYMRDVEASMRA